MPSFQTYNIIKVLYLCTLETQTVIGSLAFARSTYTSKHLNALHGNTVAQTGETGLFCPGLFSYIDVNIT